MRADAHLDPGVQLADDVCSLTLARRMAALLDRPANALAEGDLLPRGWHVMMFNPPTSQSLLRHDGAAELGFEMPDLGLPRLMMGGRSIVFSGDIPIGAPLLRRSSLGRVEQKAGRSGAFAMVDVEHQISFARSGQPVVTEKVSYVLRPPDDQARDANEAVIAGPIGAMPELPCDALVRTFVATEQMLFRYSAITDNPHRIHYDYPYATRIEGYPALVVNGSLPQMVLLDMFREYSGREPVRYESRNRGPLFCGSPITLSVSRHGDHFALAAYDAHGAIAIEATAW